MDRECFLLVIHEDKCSAFLRTETQIYDITECRDVSTFIDYERGINLHGILLDSKRVTPEYVADLLGKDACLFINKKIKRRRGRRVNKSIEGRATSKSKSKVRRERLFGEGVYI